MGLHVWLKIYLRYIFDLHGCVPPHALSIFFENHGCGTHATNYYETLTKVRLPVGSAILFLL